MRTIILMCLMALIGIISAHAKAEGPVDWNDVCRAVKNDAKAAANKAAEADADYKKAASAAAKSKGGLTSQNTSIGTLFNRDEAKKAKDEAKTRKNHANRENKAAQSAKAALPGIGKDLKKNKK